MFQICQIRGHKSRQFFGVQSIFCPNFPSFARKLLCDKCYPYKLTVAVDILFSLSCHRLKNIKFPSWSLVLNPIEKSTLRTLSKTSWLSTLEHLPRRSEIWRSFTFQLLLGTRNLTPSWGRPKAASFSEHIYVISREQFCCKMWGDSLVWNQYSHRVDAELTFYTMRFPVLFLQVFWEKHESRFALSMQMIYISMYSTLNLLLDTVL